MIDKIKNKVKTTSFLIMHLIPSIVYIVIVSAIISVDYDVSKTCAIIIAFIFKNMLLVYFILNMIIMFFSHKLLNCKKTKYYFLKIAVTYVATSLYSYASLWIIGAFIRIYFYI